MDDQDDGSPRAGVYPGAGRNQISRPHATQAVNLDKLKVLSEVWEPERLVTLDRYHARTAPKREDLPIIVVRWDGIEYLIDGTTRINKWEHEKRSEPHEVLVIEA